MDRKVAEALSLSLSLYLSLYLFLSLSFSLSLSLYRSIHLFGYLSIYLPVYLASYLSFCLSSCPSIYLCSIYLFDCLSTWLSICLSVCLSVCLSIWLSIYLSIYLSSYLSVCLSVCLSIYVSVCLFMCLSIYLPTYLSVCLSICLSIYLSMYLPIFRPIYLSVYLIIWQEAFICARLPSKADWSWQLACPKQSNSARRPHFFEIWEHQKRTKLRYFLQNWKWRPRATTFFVFAFHVSKGLHLPRKRSDAKSYELLHLSGEIILANLKIWCSKMQPVSGNPRPDLLTYLIEMSFVFTAPARRNACLQILFKRPTPGIVFAIATKHIKTLTFASLLARRRGAESTAPATRDHIQTSKSGPRPSVFNTFDFQMCFEPQRHAIVDLSCRQMAPHPPLSRAYFSTLRSPKTLEEHRVAWLFYLFVRFYLLFRCSFLCWLFLFSNFFSSDSFSSLTLPISAASSVHVVGSLTSKCSSVLKILQYIPWLSKVPN